MQNMSLSRLWKGHLFTLQGLKQDVSVTLSDLGQEAARQWQVFTILPIGE